MKTIPELIRKAGYYTFSTNKDDYNFRYDRHALYDEGTREDYIVGMNGWQGNKPVHMRSYTEGVWDERPDKNQPWFGQIQLDGGKGDRRHLDRTKWLSQAEIEAIDLPPYQHTFWFGKRPPEELYDLESDPHQTKNLARLPEYREILLEHRSILEDWIEETGDKGQVPEDPAQLEATYLLWKDRPIFKNADVNPEYDQFR